MAYNPHNFTKSHIQIRERVCWKYFLATNSPLYENTYILHQIKRSSERRKDFEAIRVRVLSKKICEKSEWVSEWVRERSVMLKHANQNRFFF
jgi:hypothetical protein